MSGRTRDRKLKRDCPYLIGVRGKKRDCPYLIGVRGEKRDCPYLTAAVAIGR